MEAKICQFPDDDYMQVRISPLNSLRSHIYFWSLEAYLFRHFLLRLKTFRRQEAFIMVMTNHSKTDGLQIVTYNYPDLLVRTGLFSPDTSKFKTNLVRCRMVKIPNKLFLLQIIFSAKPLKVI